MCEFDKHWLYFLWEFSLQWVIVTVILRIICKLDVYNLVGKMLNNGIQSPNKLRIVVWDSPLVAMFAGQLKPILGILLSIIHDCLKISLEQNKVLVSKQQLNFSL